MAESLPWLAGLDALLVGLVLAACVACVARSFLHGSRKASKTERACGSGNSACGCTKKISDAPRT